jgi:hypothetical protein
LSLLIFDEIFNLLISQQEVVSKSYIHFFPISVLYRA